MKALMVFVLAACLTDLAEAGKFDYRDLSEAKTGRVGHLLVRYLAWTEDRCIIIQTLVFGGAGKVKAEKEICSLNGKAFYDGFTHVGLEEGWFKNGALFFNIETISLPPVVEEKLHCKVVFHNDLADHLSCKENDDQFEYSRVLMAGTGDAAGLFIRYLYPTKDECIVVQSLVPGGKGRVAAENQICSIEGQSFDAYAAINLMGGIFKNDKLILEIGVTSRAPVGEVVMLCEVVFQSGLADHLSCRKKEVCSETVECHCAALDSSVTALFDIDSKIPNYLASVLKFESTAPSVTKFTSAINENRGPQTDKVSPFFEVKRN